MRPQDLAIVRDILKTILPAQTQTYVFGSRAKGTLKKAADLDLAIDLGRAMTTKEIIALDEAFDESNLPYRVDVVDLQVVNAEFKTIIDRDKVPLPLR